VDTILRIFLGESYNGIRVLVDLSMCILIIPPVAKEGERVAADLGLGVGLACSF
jgi:hypothetical protein